MRSCFVVFTCLLVLAATPLAADDPGNPIGHGLWRISGSSPSFPQSELEPLRQIVGGAEFVGVGEAIHTSGGFYEMKDRIFRYLVEQMGFRALGMETGFIRADRVEQYIQTGQGTAEAAAMPFITVVWRSNEVLAMVKWMREWNVAHPDDRVHFYGFDIQAQALANATAVIDVLHAMGITDDDSRITGIHACDGVDAFYFLDGLPYPPELYQQCDAALTATAAYFDANEKEIERVTSADTLAYARVHLVGQQTWQEEIFYYDDGMRSGRARDRGMAYVAQALRDIRFPHARTMLWAHNAHMAKNGSTNAYVDVDMGTYLTQDLGDQKYVAIAQIARDLYLDWPALGLCGQFPVETDQWIEGYFNALVPDGGVLANLHAQPPFLIPGATYTLASVPMVPADHFDALVYLTRSPGMHYLTGVQCTQ